VAPADRSGRYERTSIACDVPEIEFSTGGPEPENRDALAQLRRIAEEQPRRRPETN
jgi:hypothetical protein